MGWFVVMIYWELGTTTHYCFEAVLLLLFSFNVQLRWVEGSDIILGVFCWRVHCGGLSVKK